MIDTNLLMWGTIGRNELNVGGALTDRLTDPAAIRTEAPPRTNGQGIPEIHSGTD